VLGLIGIASGYFYDTTIEVCAIWSDSRLFAFAQLSYVSNIEQRL
jgi:hypothetical protein